jgi:uncharacterized protein (DUF58 family)
MESRCASDSAALMTLLNAETLARLAGTKLRARVLVDGVLSGLHKSPHQGQSVEFAEHKEYAPGDELRHLDWKAYGKFDKYYVKRFEQESNLRAVMLVDASASMGYRSGALSKLDIAKVMAGTLSHLTIRQQDMAGLTLFSSKKVVELAARTSPSHLQALIETLESIEPQGGTNVSEAVDRLAERLPKRSVVYVFSDLFDEQAGALQKLLTLKARKHDVVIFHLLDRSELEFSFDDFTRFESLEDERQLTVHPREIRQSFLSEFTAFLDETKRRCVAADVEYVRVVTDEALDNVLVQFLSKRTQVGR